MGLFRDCPPTRTIRPPRTRIEPTFQNDKSLIDTQSDSLCTSEPTARNVTLQPVRRHTFLRSSSIAFCSASSTTGPTRWSPSRRTRRTRSLLVSTAMRSRKTTARSLFGLISATSADTVCREVGWALFSAAQPKSARRGHRTHRDRPPAPRFLLRRPPGPFLCCPIPLRGFIAPSPRRQPTSAKTITTALMSPQPTSWLSPQTQNQ